MRARSEHRTVRYRNDAVTSVGRTFPGRVGGCPRAAPNHGAPVSPYTVMQVLGHSSLGLIEKTYGHLLNVQHRSPVVEYRRTELLELAARRAESA